MGKHSKCSQAFLSSIKRCLISNRIVLSSLFRAMGMVPDLDEVEVSLALVRGDHLPVVGHLAGLETHR